MPRGGRRQGKPGSNYSNRTDMQLGQRQAPIMRVPGQQYGQQAEQVRAQQALPVAVPGGPPSPPPGTAPTPIIPLDAPTMRPNEPLTAGVNIGAGPGAPMPAQPSTVRDLLASLSADSPETAELLDYLASGGR